MKNFYVYLVICNFLLCIFQPVKSQLVIGKDTTIEKGVILKVSSPDKGVILPMMKVGSKNNYAPFKVVPPTGTLVFNTKTVGSFPNEIYKGLYWWDNDASSWTPFALNVKNYTIKYTNQESKVTNFWVDNYIGVPIFGKFEFSDLPSEFTKISDSEMKFNSAGIYSVTINLDLYDTVTGGSGGIKVQILKNGSSAGITTRYITSQTSESYFSTNFTEYLDITDGDIIKIQAMKATDKSRTIQFNLPGTSSITISRIR